MLLRYAAPTCNGQRRLHKVDPKLKLAAPSHRRDEDINVWPVRRANVVVGRFSTISAHDNERPLVCLVRALPL